jgi:hypothetical protein
LKDIKQLNQKTGIDLEIDGDKIELGNKSKEKQPTYKLSLIQKSRVIRKFKSIKGHNQKIRLN